MLSLVPLWKFLIPGHVMLLYTCIEMFNYSLPSVCLTKRQDIFLQKLFLSDIHVCFVAVLSMYIWLWCGMTPNKITVGECEYEIINSASCTEIVAFVIFLAATLWILRDVLLFDLLIEDYDLAEYNAYPTRCGIGLCAKNKLQIDLFSRFDTIPGYNRRTTIPSRLNVFIEH